MEAPAAHSFKQSERVCCRLISDSTRRNPPKGQRLGIESGRVCFRSIVPFGSSRNDLPTISLKTVSLPAATYQPTQALCSAFWQHFPSQRHASPRNASPCFCAEPQCMLDVSPATVKAPTEGSATFQAQLIPPKQLLNSTMRFQFLLRVPAGAGVLPRIRLNML